MADFVEIHKKNNRFSVNRDKMILIRLSETELSMWQILVKVLQTRRNTGPQIETFLYLLRKYEKKIKRGNDLARAEWASVRRDKAILFKVNADELKLWLSVVTKYGTSKINCFIRILDKEYFFQDELEVISEL
jgi:hypothetical protein